tara:strand:+ start:112189 stop:112455 length:267 start_codon:yes stop_codon:yes gene_type:complete
MNENYQQVILESGQKDQVEVVLDSYLDEIVGEHTGSLKNSILTDSCKRLNSAVDYVQNSLPNGVDRVDGNSVCPILMSLINSKKDIIE